MLVNAHRLFFRSFTHGISGIFCTDVSILALSCLFIPSNAKFDSKSPTAAHWNSGLVILFTALDTFCASHTHIGFTFHLWSMNIFIIFVIVLYADSAPGMIVPSANFNACNDVLILSIIGKVSTITHMASACHICCSISDRISALVSHIAPLTHVCVTVSIVGSPFSSNISGIASLFSNNVTTHSNASDLNFSLWVAVFIPLIVFAIP